MNLHSFSIYFYNSPCVGPLSYLGYTYIFFSNINSIYFRNNFRNETGATEAEFKQVYICCNHHIISSLQFHQNSLYHSSHIFRLIHSFLISTKLSWIFFNIYSLGDLHQKYIYLFVSVLLMIIFLPSIFFILFPHLLSLHVFKCYQSIAYFIIYHY